MLENTQQSGHMSLLLMHVMSLTPKQIVEMSVRQKAKLSVKHYLCMFVEI